MLVNILGWAEGDIIREEKVDSGYFDYQISTVDFSFIVEAKRSFKDFSLPVQGRSCSLGTLEKGNSEVIAQLRSYLIDKSLAYGVITNGHQFIVGKFVNTTGQDWRKTQVQIFRSIDDIEKSFIHFYNILSKESILLNRTMAIAEEKEKPQVLIDSLKAGDQVLVRNEFSSPLSGVITAAFSELTSEDESYERELLEHCYVINADIKKYNSDLGVVFLDNPPEFDDKILPAKNTESIKNQLKEKLDDEHKGGEIPPVIIIIGGKGVGKTTFIKYFFSTLSSKEKNSKPTVYIDFRNKTEQDIKDTQQMCKNILEKLKENYPELSLHSDGVLKQIYHREIKENKEGVWKNIAHNEEQINLKVSNLFEEKMKDSVIHLEAVSRYLRVQCSKKVCIVFDNADQLDDSAQRSAFLLATSLQRRLKSVIIISLREGYYYKWKNKPPFDAFMSSVFHISAPPYREVIKRRLNYIDKFFKFKEIDTEVNNKKVKLTPDGFKDLFSNIKLTLFDEHKASAVLEFLEDTSYPNIRLGLDKLNKFLVSGHSKLYVYMTNENYRIPIWEFAKSIALESRLFYRHDSSMLFNFFYPSINGRSHFLKIRIMYFLLDQTEWVVHLDRYVKVKEILDVFKMGDFSHSIIIEELNLLLQNNMIDTNTVTSDVEILEQASELSSVKVTYQGAYYFNKILTEFYYHELMLQDTPIYSEAHFIKLKTVFPEGGSSNRSELNKRYDSVICFLDYLKLENEKEMIRLSKEGGAKCLSTDIFRTFIYNESLERSLGKVSAKLQQLQLPVDKNT